MKKQLIIITAFLFSIISFAQSDLEKTLKAGELLLNGLTIFKTSKTDAKKDSKFIESVCVKNKLTEKIIFKIIGKDEQDNKIEKELVVQNEGKECLFNLPKGIYNYEVILSNKEIYKKGEYKFEDDIVVTIKKED